MSATFFTQFSVLHCSCTAVTIVIVTVVVVVITVTISISFGFFHTGGHAIEAVRVWVPSVFRETNDVHVVLFFFALESK